MQVLLPSQAWHFPNNIKTKENERKRKGKIQANKLQPPTLRWLAVNMTMVPYFCWFTSAHETGRHRCNMRTGIGADEV